MCGHRKFTVWPIYSVWIERCRATLHFGILMHQFMNMILFHASMQPFAFKSGCLVSVIIVNSNGHGGRGVYPGVGPVAEDTGQIHKLVDLEAHTIVGR